MTRLIGIAVSAGLAFWTVAASAGNGTPGETPSPPPAPPPAAQPGSATPPPPAPPPPAPSPKQGTPALVLDTAEYEGLLGKSVRAVNGDDLGRIIDVIVDKEGRPRAAIIDFGGFLGVGSRKIAVDWRVLKFATPDGKTGPVTLQLSRNQVRVSPEYKAGEPIVVLGATSPGAPGEGEQAVVPAAPAAPPPAQPAAQDKPQEKQEKAPEAPAEKSADKPAEKPEKGPE